MTRTFATLFTALLVVTLGCATGAGKLDPGKVSQLRVGSTTKAQAQQMFGKPSDIDLAPGRPEVWVYRTGGGSSSPISLGDVVRSSPVKPPVSLPTGSSRGSSGASTLKLVFDQRGVLADYKFNQKGR